MTVSAESLGFLTPAQLKAQQLEQQQTGSATGSALNTPQNPIAQNNTPTIVGGKDYAQTGQIVSPVNNIQGSGIPVGQQSVGQVNQQAGQPSQNTGLVDPKSYISQGQTPPGMTQQQSSNGSTYWKDAQGRMYDAQGNIMANNVDSQGNVSNQGVGNLSSAESQAKVDSNGIPIPQTNTTTTGNVNNNTQQNQQQQSLSGMDFAKYAQGAIQRDPTGTSASFLSTYGGYNPSSYKTGAEAVDALNKIIQGTNTNTGDAAHDARSTQLVNYAKQELSNIQAASQVASNQQGYQQPSTNQITQGGVQNAVTPVTVSFQPQQNPQTMSASQIIQQTNNTSGTNVSSSNTSLNGQIQSLQTQLASGKITEQDFNTGVANAINQTQATTQKLQNIPEVTPSVKDTTTPQQGGVSQVASWASDIRNLTDQQIMDVLGSSNSSISLLTSAFKANNTTIDADTQSMINMLKSKEPVYEQQYNSTMTSIANSKNANLSYTMSSQNLAQQDMLISQQDLMNQRGVAQANSDAQMSFIMEKNAKLEGFLKASLASQGIPPEGVEGATLLATKMNQAQLVMNASIATLNQPIQELNTQLGHLAISNQQTLLNYSKQVTDINNTATDAQNKALSDFNTNVLKISEDISNTKVQADEKKMQAMTNLSTNVANIQQGMTKDIVGIRQQGLQEMNTARSQAITMLQDTMNKTGYSYSLDPNTLAITQDVDANGQPLRTLDYIKSILPIQLAQMKPDTTASLYMGKWVNSYGQEIQGLKDAPAPSYYSKMITDANGNQIAFDPKTGQTMNVGNKFTGITGGNTGGNTSLPQGTPTADGRHPIIDVQKDQQGNYHVNVQDGAKIVPSAGSDLNQCGYGVNAIAVSLGGSSIYGGNDHASALKSKQSVATLQEPQAGGTMARWDAPYSEAGHTYFVEGVDPNGDVHVVGANGTDLGTWQHETIPAKTWQGLVSKGEAGFTPTIQAKDQAIPSNPADVLAQAQKQGLVDPSKTLNATTYAQAKDALENGTNYVQQQGNAVATKLQAQVGAKTAIAQATTEARATEALRKVSDVKVTALNSASKHISDIALQAAKLDNPNNPFLAKTFGKTFTSMSNDRDALVNSMNGSIGSAAEELAKFDSGSIAHVEDVNSNKSLFTTDSKTKGGALSALVSVINAKGENYKNEVNQAGDRGYNIDTQFSTDSLNNFNKVNTIIDAVNKDRVANGEQPIAKIDMTKFTYKYPEKKTSSPVGNVTTQDFYNQLNQ